MGNCLGTPVENHSLIVTQPSTPVESKENAIKQSKSRNNRHGAENRGSTVAGGGCAAAEKRSPIVRKPSTPDDSKGKAIRQSKSSNNRHGDENGGSAAAGGGVAAAEAVPPSGRIITPNLKMFTYAELKSATRSFRPETVVGEGGFGKVFKGWVDGETLAPSKPGVGMPVAIKKSNPDSWQGLQEWKAEVEFLGKFSHPNLVKLLGYCWEDRQFLLIYEYMEGGSLETHLFRKGGDPIPWDTRLNIATGAAQGLTFLHTTENQVIYRDFKASNILLDGDFNAKLSDFGLAKLGPADGDTHVTTRIIGTYGYAAPEYVATGHLYVKSDVYGFGVMLLELLTGLKVVDLNRPNGAHNLLDWAKPSLAEKRKLKKIMDPRLENQYPPKAAVQAAELVLKCLESEPRHRPTMEEVLVTLQHINSIKMNPKDSKASEKYPAALRHHQTPGNSHRYSQDRYPLHRNNGGMVEPPHPSPR
ncbi:probable serine/threonine-protein kinase PIX13 isoform X1 [Rhododendron vialii]|uniref:probable serine/threonine-protein kinase PIX13 isoform X1 n=1 Tax=Rhododendron vialii TaxID=182163 RepID=UPI00265EB6CB|nr:probable serine/threonine-protein kinase PIX13 isoform X1 [Rhododendron vialii]